LRFVIIDMKQSLRFQINMSIFLRNSKTSLLELWSEIALAKLKISSSA